jgi:hypothetical protein
LIGKQNQLLFNNPSKPNAAGSGGTLILPRLDDIGPEEKQALQMQ